LLARKRTIETISEFDIEHSILAEADDGVEALDKFKELKPNLIITDIEMPNMDGMELVNEIRKVDTKVNIIIISSLSNEQVKQTVKSDKFTEFVKKPMDKKIVQMLLLKLEHQLVKGVTG